MTQKTNTKKELRYVASDFKFSEKSQNDKGEDVYTDKTSNVIDSVYVNHVAPEGKEPFLSIDIKTKILNEEGKPITHKAILGQPMSDEQKAINKKLREMTPEQQKKVLEAID